VNRRQDSDRWIWPFELMEKIGEGGMGVVYRARYVVNNKLFAVKLLPSDVTDTTTLERFQRELEILKKLKHPHIVRCFGGECKNKRQFYAMELVEGGTLEQLLAKRGRLAWELVVEYGLQMCEGLAYSHQHGIVHRDVKPGNFLLTNSGRLKLSDFGLASVVAARRITAEGRTMGTYQYMAPEQIRGKEITPRTDLYSLGCVFFELLTGRPPFLGDTAAEILHQHIKTPAPRVAQLAPDVPAGLEQLVNDLLQKSPEVRPADAETVARRLKAVTQTIIIKPNLRPFEQSSSDSSPMATETKSAPTIAGPAPEPAAPSPRWAWPAVIAGFGILLMVIFSLLSQRSSAGASAEELWIAAFDEEETEIRIAAANALGELCAILHVFLFEIRSTKSETQIRNHKSNDRNSIHGTSLGNARFGI
jgi:eukaryotic-like serine/threonine-protein kinase